MNTSYNEIIQALEANRVGFREKRAQIDKDQRADIEAIRADCARIGHVMKRDDGIFSSMSDKPVCAVCGWWEPSKSPGEGPSNG